MNICSVQTGRDVTVHPGQSWAGSSASRFGEARAAVVALVLFVTLCAEPLRAQEAANPETDDAAPTGPTLELERFEVTGSFIPFASTQTALPVTVVNSQAITDSGIATNVLDLLHKVAPQFTGSHNLGTANANVSMGLTAGGSMVSFRNLQTLVLVNGRRMAYAPGLAAGGLQFVDVNLIPVAAIDRIEVLEDGASATYGTDAVAGVVNIILRTDFEGVEVAAHYGVSTEPGNFAEYSFSAVGGMGKGRTEFTFSVEEAHSDPLAQYDREFASPTYGTASFGGVINTRVPNVLSQFYVLNPALNRPPAGHTDLATLVAQGVYIPVDANNLIQGLGPEQQYAFNLARYTRLLQENRRRSVTLNFKHKLSDRVALFGDFIYAATNTDSLLNAQPLMPSLPASNPSNPTTQTMQVRNRFVDYPRLYFYDSASIRGIVGARGTLASGLTWEAAVDRNDISQDFTNRNLIITSKRVEAIANNLLDLSAREQAPGAVEASGIFGTAWGKADSTITTGDARITGEFPGLPAGRIGFALGTEYRVETLEQDSDPYSQEATFNWDSANRIDPFEEDRDVWSAYAEVRVPLLGASQDVPGFRSLEMSAAVRHERYSDTDDPTVPKFTLAWRPAGDELLLRATYSESFVAPTLFELFGPTEVRDAVPIEFDQLGGGLVVRDFQWSGGANPDLRPSRSKNLTFGFVWSPRALKGFSMTASYFDIEQEDLTGTIDPELIVQDVEYHGPTSPYADFVRVGAFDGSPITAPGQLSANTTGDMYVSGVLVNVANLKLNGVDLKAEYYRGVTATGRIDASVAVTYYESYTYQTLPSVPPEETVGLATFGNGTLPRWQSYATLAWSLGRWRVNLNWQHIPGVEDPEGDGTEIRPFHTRTYDSVDASVSCTFDLRKKWLKQLVVRTGVNNVSNEMPPYGDGTFPDANADTGTYSPIGRVIYAECRFRF